MDNKERFTITITKPTFELLTFGLTAVVTMAIFLASYVLALTIPARDPFVFAAISTVLFWIVKGFNMAAKTA